MEKKPKIYLDNNSTTFLDPVVAERMSEEMRLPTGNPSSVHSFGLDARTRLTKARRKIAEFMGGYPSEIVFTSGGTESMNFLLNGCDGHLITSSVEHSCVHRLAERNERATFLSPGRLGAITPEQVEEAIRPNTGLIALMAVNNETGVETDIDSIAELARAHKIPFVVDGVALLGKRSFCIPAGVVGMGFSGHKIHGPKGVGFVYVRQNHSFQPLHIGGGQENNLRGGTENLIGIIGLSAAVERIDPASFSLMERLRDRFECLLKKEIPDLIVNGEGPRVSNTANLSFPGLDGESLLMSLDLEGLAVSHGSACSTGALEPSRVLLNMGISRHVADTAIRFSLSRFTTEDEIDRASDIVIRVVKRMQAKV